MIKSNQNKTESLLSFSIENNSSDDLFEDIEFSQETNQANYEFEFDYSFQTDFDGSSLLNNNLQNHDQTQQLSNTFLDEISNHEFDAFSFESEQEDDDQCVPLLSQTNHTPLNDINLQHSELFDSPQIHIPIYGLFDNDPHGVEIFLTYKIGTKVIIYHYKKLEYDAKNLTCPKMKCIGVFSSDWNTYNLRSI